MSDKTDNGISVSLELAARANQEGISPAQLGDMLRRSARITHPDGNRRYHDYLFKVEGGKLLDFMKLVEPEPEAVKCVACKDKGVIPVFDECPACEGRGCKKCDQGLVSGSIPCPDCRPQQPIFGSHRI